MPERRFPPPWSAEVQPTHYVVRDANKQQLAYVYFENEPGRRSAAKLLTKDEARRIAAVARNHYCCVWAKNCRSCDIHSRHEIETMAGFVFARLGAFDIVR